MVPSISDRESQEGNFRDQDHQGRLLEGGIWVGGGEGEGTDEGME